MKKIAFTLSEVLITLMVLGVISAITVPTLFATYQKNVTVEKLKKIHSTLAQVSNRILVDEGGAFVDLNSDLSNILNILQLFSYEGQCKFAKEHFFSYLSVAETKEFSLPVCEGGECFDAAPDMSLQGVHLVDGTTMAIFPFESAQNHCFKITICSGSDCDKEEPAQFCGIPIIIDINGESKPNRLGRDMFLWEYRINDELEPSYRSRFVPMGYGYSEKQIEEMFGGDSECSRDNPMLCARKIMNDGWRIKNDYPW